MLSMWSRINFNIFKYIEYKYEYINENDTVVQSKKKCSLIEDNVNIFFFYLFRFNKIFLKFDITVALILISSLLMNLIIKPEK